MEAGQAGRGRGCLSTLLGAALLVAAASAIGFAVGKRMPEAPAVPGLTKVVVEERLADTPTVLLAVRSLARLETVAYHMERVIDLKQRYMRMFGLIGADDWILLIAVGDAVAGIDLAKLRDEDVQVETNPRSVRIRLPPAELLSVRLDNGRTYVHSRKTEMMAERSQEIETRARRLGEDSIRNAALESGILERAQQGAEQTLTTLARSMGFERVEIIRSER